MFEDKEAVMIGYGDTLHVLLMLSSKEPPDPVTEVEWHAQEALQLAESKKPTFFATTRQIKGLRPGVSEVHYYGDSQLGNAYLGGGVFHSYVPLSSPKGQEILSNSYLYKTYGCPGTTRGFIGITDFKAISGQSIDDLKGVMRSSKKPLAMNNLPASAARIQIYFYHDSKTKELGDR